MGIVDFFPQNIPDVIQHSLALEQFFRLIFYYKTLLRMLIVSIWLQLHQVKKLKKKACFEPKISRRIY